MLYKAIFEQINQEIERIKQEPEREGLTERDKHYFTQGLEVAKQIIEQLDEFETDPAQYAHERLEEIINVYNEILLPAEIEEIVNTVLSEDIIE